MYVIFPHKIYVRIISIHISIIGSTILKTERSKPGRSKTHLSPKGTGYSKILDRPSCEETEHDNFVHPQLAHLAPRRTLIFLTKENKK